MAGDSQGRRARAACRPVHTRLPPPAGFQRGWVVGLLGCVGLVTLSQAVSAPSCSTCCSRGSSGSMSPRCSSPARRADGWARLKWSTRCRLRHAVLLFAQGAAATHRGIAQRQPHSAAQHQLPLHPAAQQRLLLCLALTRGGVLLDRSPQPGEAPAVVVQHPHQLLAVRPACTGRRGGGGGGGQEGREGLFGVSRHTARGNRELRPRHASHTAARPACSVPPGASPAGLPHAPAARAGGSHPWPLLPP